MKRDEAQRRKKQKGRSGKVRIGRSEKGLELLQISNSKIEPGVGWG